MESIFLYAALFLGVFAEGEIALITGTLTAQNGSLNIYMVALVALVATIAADWLCYFSGKIMGEKIFKHFPNLMEKTEKPKNWIRQYPVLLLFIYRYLYGFRIVTLIILGVSGIPVKKFIPLSLLSIIIWVIVFSLLGFHLGEMVNQYIIQLENITTWVFSAVLLIIFLAVAIRYIRQRKS